MSKDVEYQYLMHLCEKHNMSCNKNVIEGFGFDSVSYSELPAQPKGYTYHGYTNDSGNGRYKDKGLDACKKGCAKLGDKCKGFTLNNVETGSCMYDTSTLAGYPKPGQSNANPDGCWRGSNAGPESCRFWRKVNYSELPAQPKGYIYHGYTNDSGNGRYKDKGLDACKKGCANLGDKCKGFTLNNVETGSCMYDTSKLTGYPKPGQSNANPDGCWRGSNAGPESCRFWRKVKVDYEELSTNEGKEKGYVYPGYTNNSGLGAYADAGVETCKTRCAAMEDGCKGFTVSGGKCMYHTSGTARAGPNEQTNANPDGCWRISGMPDNIKAKNTAITNKQAEIKAKQDEKKAKLAEIEAIDESISTKQGEKTTLTNELNGLISTHREENCRFWKKNVTIV